MEGPDSIGEILACASFAAHPASGTGIMSAPRPDILVFFTDQQRWDTCGCYGQRLPVTPVLDRLAAEGVRFANTFTCQPVCGPARAALQTGLYPTRLGCETNHRMLPLNADTIAKRLGAAGYRTGYLGKWHLASFGPRDMADDVRIRAVPPERRGGYADWWLAADALEFTSHGYGGHMFDDEGRKREWPESVYRVDAQTDWLLQHLRERPTDQPWLTFVSYLEPHHQNDRNVYEGPHGSKQAWAGYEVPGDLVGTDGDWHANYADYLGCCNALDRALGRVVDELKRQGRLDSTLIIFTSDHGTHFRTRNPEYKRSCHDNSLRIPLVVRGPGFRGGQVVERLASNLDLPGTILAAAGVDRPKVFDGGTLQEISDGSLDRTAVLAQISESQCGRCIRTARWTYSVTSPGGNQDGQLPTSPLYIEDFLYDNAADPALANERRHLRALLLAELERVGERPPEIQPRT
jgi:uncharacterized sulfatase